MHLPTLLTTPRQRRQARRLHEQAALEQVERLASARRESILDARDFVADFVRARWEAHWPMIRIECGATEAELRALGRLPRDDGVRACCGLVRVPVIHEEIGIALWERLAEDAVRDGRRGLLEPETPSAADAAVPSASDLTTSWMRARSRRRSSKERRGRTSDAVEVSAAGAEKQPRRDVRCVFCSGCSELACRIPEEIAQLSRGDARDNEQPFWTTREEEPEKDRRSSAASKTSTGSCWSEKIFKGANTLAIQKALLVFAGSLAYGYGNRACHTFATPVTVAT